MFVRRRNCAPAAHPTSFPAPLSSKDVVVAGPAKSDSRGDTEPPDARQFDSTGMFHWCSPQAMSNCVIVSVHAVQPPRKQTVIVVVTTVHFSSRRTAKAATHRVTVA